MKLALFGWNSLRKLGCGKHCNENPRLDLYCQKNSLGIIPCVQINKKPCQNVTDADKSHKAPGSATVFFLLMTQQEVETSSMLCSRLYTNPTHTMQSGPDSSRTIVSQLRDSELRKSQIFKIS